MDDVIAALVAAECGSRETDCSIHVAVHGWKLTKIGPDAKGENVSEFYTPHGRLIPDWAYPHMGKIGTYYHVPTLGAAYTTSIDDAAKLVPPGHAWTLYSDGCAGCAPTDDGPDDDRDMPTADCHAPTPALALCIAALAPEPPSRPPRRREGRGERDQKAPPTRAADTAAGWPVDAG